MAPSAKNTSPNYTPLTGLMRAYLVTPLNLEREAQDRVESELTWLFAAATHLGQICRGELDRSQPIAQPIPLQAQKIISGANNYLLDKAQNPIFFMDIHNFHGKLETTWQKSVLQNLEGQIKTLKIQLRTLSANLATEAQQGDAALTNHALQAQIRGFKIQMGQQLQSLAELMSQAYGILILSPDEIPELLA